MQPGSRHVAVGLRQEGRVPAVFPRHAAHHALEAQRLVAGAQRVGAVQEVHLELSRTVFGERGGRGDALRAADRVDAREHGRILVEVGHRVDLGAELATTRARQRRWLRLSGGGALSVHEVELVLDRDHRREVETVELVEHLHEDMSRVAEERPTVGLVHRDLQLRDTIVLPGHRHQRVGQRTAGAVGVALVEAESGGLHRAAEDIQSEHRPRQQHPRLVDAGDGVAVDAFAALDGVEVVQEDIEEARPGVLCEEGGQFRGVGRSHPVRIRGGAQGGNTERIKTMTCIDILYRVGGKGAAAVV